MCVCVCVYVCVLFNWLVLVRALRIDQLHIYVFFLRVLHNYEDSFPLFCVTETYRTIMKLIPVYEMQNYIEQSVVGFDMCDSYTLANNKFKWKWVYEEVRGYKL